MIVNDLQKRIMNEEFEENHKLPTEEKLIEELKQFSDGTLQQLERPDAPY